MAEEPLVPLSAMTWISEGLKRPECVHTTTKGEVSAGDHHAGIAEIGKPRRKMIGCATGLSAQWRCQLPTREVLIANLGPGGGVWRLDRDWRLYPASFQGR